MTQFATQCTGIDASGFGIGRNRNCPSFSAGVGAYLIGTSLTTTPTKNMFNGTLDGRIFGTPDAIGLKQGPYSQMTTSVAATGVMTISAITGDALAPGQTVEGGTLPLNTVIMPFGTNGTTGTGGLGTYQLTLPPAVLTAGTFRAFTTLFDFATTTSALFGISSAVTIAAFFKGVLNQSLLADGPTGGNMGLLLPGGAQDVQAFGRDANNFAANSTTASTFTVPNSSVYSMGAAQYTTTTAQAFIQRSGFPRVASVVQNRAAGAMGSASKLRFGHQYLSPSPSTSAFLLVAYSKLLSDPELDELFAYGKDLAVRAGAFV